MVYLSEIFGGGDPSKGGGGIFHTRAEKIGVFLHILDILEFFSVPRGGGLGHQGLGRKGVWGHRG